ncbi:unnamed protein product [Urochloa decumbens]|uniref:Uncharacterized protein n=1 Tax=Urochloa decumbens TaxID=240449 RepID=A0ABC8W8T2_9POAL
MAAKRRRGERDGRRAAKKEKQRLYLVFDDWPWGYSIRELDLSSPAATAAAEPRNQRLPRPFIRLEAPRRFRRGCGPAAPAAGAALGSGGLGRLRRRPSTAADANRPPAAPPVTAARPPSPTAPAGGALAAGPSAQRPPPPPGRRPPQTPSKAVGAAATPNPETLSRQRRRRRRRAHMSMVAAFIGAHMSPGAAQHLGRRFPLFFAAAGTRIIATHRRNPWDDDSVPDGFLPMVDVRSRGVTFGPGQVLHDLPIYLPVPAGGGGAEGLFELDTITVRTLSLKPLWPPRLENESSADAGEWAWHELRDPPPFHRLGVTSYAVAPDGRTVLFSTEEQGTFTFDAAAADAEQEKELLDVAWTRLGEWALPFAGRAHFVRGLNAFVGLSNDPATAGHLCSCDAAAAVDIDGGGGGGAPPAWKLGKEKMFGEDDPGERHVGATLLYMGRSEFCLVQSVSVGEHGDAAADQEEMEIEEHEEVEVPRRSSSHLYRLTTFSVSYDSNGDLTTGESCRVRCYRVPEATTERFLHRGDPVAFWL